MNTEGIIELKGEEVKYKFGMKQIRLFMQGNNVNNIQDYWSSLGLLEEQTLESYELLAKVFRSSLEVFGKNKNVPNDNDDLLDIIFSIREI